MSQGWLTVITGCKASWSPSSECVKCLKSQGTTYISHLLHMFFWHMFTVNMTSYFQQRVKHESRSLTSLTNIFSRMNSTTIWALRPLYVANTQSEHYTKFQYSFSHSLWSWKHSVEVVHNKAGMSRGRVLPLLFPRLIRSPGTILLWLAQAAWEICIGHRFMKVKRGFDIKTNGSRLKSLLFIVFC